MALIIAIGMMSVLSLTTVTVISYSTTNNRHAYRSDASQTAFSLAEAAINNAVAVLNSAGDPDVDPDGTALNPNLLTPTSGHACPGGGSCFRAVYDEGESYWYGTLTGEVWTLHGWGVTRNSNGTAYPDVTKYARARVIVSPSVENPPNAVAWNYMLARGTSNSTTCDMDLWNSVIIDSPLYVAGNLCLRNTSKVIEPDATAPVSLIVQGKLVTMNSGKVGESTSQPVSEVGAKGGCATSISNSGVTCTAATHRVYTKKLISNPAVISVPEPDWAYWYEKANPGPKNPCNPVSATPVFDNDTTLNLAGNGSVGSFDLTPSSSYTCTGKNAWGTTVGELSWNNSTKVLTIKGAIYIDGSAYVSNGAANRYVGSGTLYLTGVFNMSGGTTRLCGAIVSGNCDFANWKPNEVLMIIVANGNDGSGNSVKFVNSVQFQGGFMTKNAVDLGQSSIVEGPMIASTIKLEQSTRVKPLPYIDTLPFGTPGIDPNTYAKPSRPIYEVMK